MKEKMINGFDVTVRGTYYGADGKDRLLKVFGPVTFFIPDIVEIPNGKKRIETKQPDGRTTVKYEAQTAKRSADTPNVALYIVQRRLLPAWLETNHPGCTSFRTCSIVPGGLKRAYKPESETVSLDKPVHTMSITELKAFCKLRDLNLPVDVFVDLVAAREMVVRALEDRETEAREKRKRESGDGSDTAVLSTHQSNAPTGVVERTGPVSAIDGIPTDQEIDDPADSLI